MSMRNSVARVLGLSLGLAIAAGCDSAGPSVWGPGQGGSSSSVTGTGGGSAETLRGQLTISAATRTPRSATSSGLNYWMWAPTYGGGLDGTETVIAALQPMVLRMGGHNNDSNDPDPFNEAEIDTAIAYARAVGAEPILQVPLLADTTGAVPTADTARAMVAYANVTKSYRVRYFSLGNEPDLYPDQEANLASYTAADYCAAVNAFVPAMRAVDPNIQIVGPDLSWKYQSGGNDWLTPILSGCGSYIDIVAVHRYPFDATQAILPSAAADAEAFRSVIAALRQKLQTLGMADKPLAVTETNISWDGDPAKSTLEASPGTLPAGLWAADAFGVALEEDLWTMAFWSIREGWTLGLLTPESVKRPMYQALRLFADHSGPSLLEVTATPRGVRAYASRNAADDTTLAVIINWTGSPQEMTIEVAGLGSDVAPATQTFGPLTVNAVELPDQGTPSAWTYGGPEAQAGQDPRRL
jgi:hypothetical protein